MNAINFNEEWKFIDSKKSAIDKHSLIFELLSIAQVLLLNYASAKTKKIQNFYKIIYLKIKKFYLKRTADIKLKI